MNSVREFGEISRALGPISNKVHVIFRKEDLDAVRLQQKVVIVLDILFATTTIVTALAAGATEVIPAFDEADARSKAQPFAEGSYVLAGEKNILAIPGFASPLPLTLQKQGMRDRRLIYSTTNGTVALRRAEHAPHVYAACLLNGAAVVQHVRRSHPDDTVLVVASGSGGGVNLEDLYGAGQIVDLLAESFDPQRDLSDAALASRALFRSHDAFECLIASRIGRLMRNTGFEDEVRFAAQRDIYSVVTKLEDGTIRVVGD